MVASPANALLAMGMGTMGGYIADLPPPVNPNGTVLTEWWVRCVGVGVGACGCDGVCVCVGVCLCACLCMFGEGCVCTCLSSA